MKRVAAPILVALAVTGGSAVADGVALPAKAKQPAATDEAPARSDRLEPSVIDRATRKRDAPKAPIFPAERR